MNTAPPLLDVQDLSKRFSVGSAFARGGRQQVQAVDGVSLQVWPGETLGLVGESGCGKSTLARCLVRLHDASQGRLLFEGQDITHLNTRQMRPIRPRLQMVFQDPYASLNPRRRVGDLIAEPLRVHTRMNTAERAARVQELAALVGLRSEQLQRYPHEFSGGQRQRIGIARALALNPKLIVADEPVSALDVSIQAQVINLMADLQQQLGLTYIFIAHDLSVVRQVSTRTAVMYLGQIVEEAPTRELFQRPAHPYSAALLSTNPAIDPERRARRIVLQGEIPSVVNPPPGCRFHTRCPVAQGRCSTDAPPLTDIGTQRRVRCHFPYSLDPQR